MVDVGREGPPAGVVVFRSSSEIGYREGVCVLVTTIRARRTLSKEVESVGLCWGGGGGSQADDDADSSDGGRETED